MNRNSSLARAISAQTGIRARRIETWSIERLGPDPTLPIEEQLPHFLELEKIVGPGRSKNYDLAARRLAAGALVCSRLRSSLSDLITDGSSDNPMSSDFSTEESADAVFREYDSVATNLTTSVDSLPSAIRLVVQKFRRNAFQGSASTNETGEQVFHSAIVNLLHLFNGGEILNGQATAAMLGFDPEEFDESAFTFIEHLNLTFQNMEHAYQTMSLEDIAAMAKWLRDHAHVAIDYLEISKATDSMLDDLATQFAPMAICLIEPLVKAFGDFATFLVEIGVPDRLILLSLPR